MVDEDTELKDSVQRLHRFIVDALRTRRGDPFASPVTVAEIYQELAPYRTARAALGFEMNADYEHALVRLLAGVDGLTRLDPSQARDRLKKELDSPNPDVTLYRDYAGCDVVLNPPTGQNDWVREQLDDDATDSTDSTDEAEMEEMVLEEADMTRTGAPDWSALAALSRSETFDVEDETQDAEEPDDANDSWADTPDVEAHAVFELETYAPSPSHDRMALNATSQQPAACAHCDSVLPLSRAVKFCPFCGADQSMHPCPTCDEMLDPSWTFCIACGTHVASV